MSSLLNPAMSSLNGKVALVTGGSRGIGAAIAKALAGAGATVALSYSASPDKAQQVVNDIIAGGGKAIILQADQAVPSQVKALVQSVVQQLGPIDILVNNAGVFTGQPVQNTPDDAEPLDRQWAINVGGVVAAVREAVKTMPNGGRIINIGSCLGASVPLPGIADYSATKAALANYAKGWARDLGAKAITVNTVQPGPIDTDMNPDEGEFADTLKGFTALGRYGKPEEIAHAVVFLASPGAAYVTGTTLTVDGGFNG